MTLPELKEFIKNNSEKDIYDRFLLGQEVWYFQEHINDQDPLLFYDSFRKFMSIQLDIHFQNISIIGSAKTRFSFSPKKNFKIFDETSDFDIVLVSSDLYFKFWAIFYEISQTGYLPNYPRISSDIFRKFISIKEDSPHFDNEDLKSWQRKLSDFRARLQFEFKIYSDINYRVYQNWEAVESYHLKGIKKLKFFIDETN